MEIIVIRGQGDKQGDDIVEALLSTEQAALSRGRAELDANAHNSQTVQLVVKYRSDVILGQLIEVHDNLLGESWRGKITGIHHSVSSSEESGPDIHTQLTIEKPTEFYAP